MAKRRRRFLLDASALLDYFTGQAGRPLVLDALDAGSAISAVNFAEVLEVRGRKGQPEEAVLAALRPFDLEVLPARQAEALYASRWARPAGPGLADRFWLATVRTRGKHGLTTDGPALALALDEQVQLGGRVLNVRAQAAALPEL